MDFSLKSLCLVLILSTITYNCAGQLNITGNEKPLIIGLSQDINCIWTGAANVTIIQWFVVGLEAVAVETVTDSRSVLLALDPDSDSLDGAMFTCRATLSDGSEVEETITLIVEAIENEVSISSLINANATAGEPYTVICTVSSERPSNLSWIDPYGVVCPLNGPNTHVSNVSRRGRISTIELRFSAILTSQSGVYRCISNIAFPTSKSEASFAINVLIPEPRVSIFRDPEYPVQLFTSHSLVLTCVIELIPEVDSYVTISSRWSGHTSLTDSERRVIVSDLEGIQLMYNTSVTFSSLKSSDNGSYTCSAFISPQPESEHLIGSPVSEESIDISVVLKVTIDVAYNPPHDFTLPSPPYYRPATSVTLTCHAHNATGPVSYRWTSTCSDCFLKGSGSQSVSESILRSNSAGVHTCIAVDSVRNTGWNNTEMKLIGIGIYVDDSRYMNHIALANNSMIVSKQTGCHYCDVDIYCYSNATSSNVGYFIFPNGGRVYSDNSHYRYTIRRQSYSGIRLHNYYYHTPSMFGIFICELPDMEENTLEASIGIYSSMPNTPSVYSIKYSDWSSTNSSLLGTVECLTQYSPPTNVAWLRDGVAVEVDGESYEMMQSVIERQSYSRYNSTLLIRKAADLAGNHTYSCTITNSAGSTSQVVKTTLKAEPVVEISAPGEASLHEPFTMTCRASLNFKVAAQLIRYMVLDWVRANGRNISEEDGVIVEGQLLFSNTTTRSMVFNPLNVMHSGDYQCETKLILPHNAGSFNTTTYYHLNVLERTIFQLKFGPVVHCSRWYEDKRIAVNLERDIKLSLTSVINESCSCGFQTLQIDRGEFSCRTVKDDAIYRARLTGSSDTLMIPALLGQIQYWMKSDGTFLYTYHGNLRLGVDPLCPLEIEKLSQPECVQP